MTIGEKIRFLRQKAGLSQSQLADALTVSRAAVAKWENENGTPDIENLKALSAYFGYDVDVLIDEAKELEELKPQPNGILCGKDCTECHHKEALQCPGCKHGPGKKHLETCNIAKCARERSPDGCTVCWNRENCATLRRKALVPQERLESIARERERREAARKQSDILRMPLKIMFWVYIVENIRSLLFAENMLGRFPVCYTVSQILVLISSAVILLLLLWMVPSNPLFRSAAIWDSIYMLCHIGSWGFQAMEAHLAVQLIVSLCVSGSNVLRIYYEYEAYGEDLLIFDAELAEKWLKLRTLTIASVVGLYASMLITAVFPVLGVLAVLAASVCTLVAVVKELYYRYLSVQAVDTALCWL